MSQAQGRSKRGGRGGSGCPNILLKKKKKRKGKEKERGKEKRKGKTKREKIKKSRPRNQFVISCLIIQQEGPPKVVISFCLFASFLLLLFLFQHVHSRFWPFWSQTSNCQLWPFWQLHSETLDSEPRQGPVWQLPV